MRALIERVHDARRIDGLRLRVVGTSKWRELRFAPDRMAFWTSFLPEKRRRLLKDGIHVDKIRYWSDVLSRDLGRGGEMLVKYHPRDLSRIFVRRADGHYIEARYRNLAYPAVTLWEWRNAKRRLLT